MSPSASCSSHLPAEVVTETLWKVSAETSHLILKALASSRDTRFPSALIADDYNDDLFNGLQEIPAAYFKRSQKET